ncbi:MAG: hypothetical protein ACOCXT_04865 [Candidatus Dojkabacteria bacterium]
MSSLVPVVIASSMRRTNNGDEAMPRPAAEANQKTLAHLSRTIQRIPQTHPYELTTCADLLTSNDGVKAVFLEGIGIYPGHVTADATPLETPAFWTGRKGLQLNVGTSLIVLLDRASQDDIVFQGAVRRLIHPQTEADLSKAGSGERNDALLTKALALAREVNALLYSKVTGVPISPVQPPSHDGEYQIEFQGLRYSRKIPHDLFTNAIASVMLLLSMLSRTESDNELSRLRGDIDPSQLRRTVTSLAIYSMDDIAQLDMQSITEAAKIAHRLSQN